MQKKNNAEKRVKVHQPENLVWSKNGGHDRITIVIERKIDR